MSERGQGNKPNWPARIEKASMNFAHILESTTKVIGFVCAMAAWLIFGFVAWLATLLCGIIVLLAVILVRLIAGLRIESVSHKFLQVMKFWPEGFTALAQAFWTSPPPPQEDQQTESTYLQAIFRILYISFIAFLVFCIWKNQNPIEFFARLSANYLIIFALFAGATIGYALYKDDARSRMRARAVARPQAPYPEPPPQR